MNFLVHMCALFCICESWKEICITTDTVSFTQVTIWQSFELGTLLMKILAEGWFTVKVFKPFVIARERKTVFSSTVGVVMWEAMRRRLKDKPPASLLMIFLDIFIIAEFFNELFKFSLRKSPLKKFWLRCDLMKFETKPWKSKPSENYFQHFTWKYFFLPLIFSSCLVTITYRLCVKS